MRNGYFRAGTVDVLPGLGQEFSPVPKGGRFRSHNHACAVELLPGLGLEFPIPM
jgi:hypothetical protein